MRRTVALDKLQLTPVRARWFELHNASFEKFGPFQREEAQEETISKRSWICSQAFAKRS